MEEKIINLTKEQALSIAKINNDKIHCFLAASFGLIGADHDIKSFAEKLNKASSIEVGGNNCRSMSHALVLWIEDEPYFFEHNEEKLKTLLKELEK